MRPSTSGTPSDRERSDRLHRASPILITCLALLSSGCFFSLPDDLFKLNGLERCPEEDMDVLAKRIAGFDHATSTSDLKCALGQLRVARPQAIHETSACSKVCFLLADRHRRAEDRERLAAEGVRWAEIALDGDPRVARYGIRGDETVEEGRVNYYLAVNLGIAVRDHTALALKNLKKLSRVLQVAIRLSPNVDSGGPLRVAGLLYLVAPPWPQGIGDGDRALELLERAVHEHPEHPLNHIFYAQALHELEEGDEAEVKRHLDEGIRLLAQDKWGRARERWTKLLRDLAKEANVDLLPVEAPAKTPAEAPAEGTAAHQ
jgi:hypothetical protein